MTTIGFLHTAGSHLATFDALVRELGGGGVSSIADVDEGLLALARRVGPDDPAVRRGVESMLAVLRERGADAIVCTCSTIGGTAEEVGTARGWDVVRVDRAMAERAVEIAHPDGRIVVLAALESTLGPTEHLLREVASGRAPEGVLRIESMLVDGAWARFEAGAHDDFVSLVAEAVRVAAADGADVIVLAQASMAPAAEVASVPVPVLASPGLAVEAAISASTGRGARRR